MMLLLHLTYPLITKVKPYAKVQADYGESTENFDQNLSNLVDTEVIRNMSSHSQAF